MCGEVVCYSKNSFYNTGFVNNSMHAISEMTASLLTSDFFTYLRLE